MKFDLQINAKSIFRDQTFFARPLHLQAMGPHVDFIYAMKKWHCNHTTIQRHSLAARTCSNQRRISGRLSIKLLHQYDNDTNNNDGENYPCEPIHLYLLASVQQMRTPAFNFHGK
jgi:hypothetical protein